MFVTVQEIIHQFECLIPFFFACWNMGMIIDEIYKDQISLDIIQFSKQIKMSQPVLILIEAFR